ncbi:MAG: ABC transporter substrate-binding protein [Candidatus Taylorbacteria bacterium]
MPPPIESESNSLSLSKTILKSFSITEKVIFALASITLTLSALALLWQVNENFVVTVPARGGTLVEGVVGFPRLVNPLLSYTNAGEDMGALIYSGLLKAAPDGTLINDLAKEYTISENGLTYTFVLKDNIFFHDGKPVTTDDIEFTIKKAVDPALKSAERVKWEGVTIEKVDKKTIKFTLKNPYTPFLENMTLGILPEHIWKNADLDQFTFSQFNTEPVGSGPYKVKSLKRNEEGIPLYYKLEAFDKYALGEPLIKNIILKFYTTEADLLVAYKRGEIDTANAISGENASLIVSKDAEIHKSPLPRVFGIFFNQNQSEILADIKVREALNLALDRDEIVAKVLHGFGDAIEGPIPPGLIPDSQILPQTKDDIESRTEKANKILTIAGWSKNASGILEKKDKDGASTPLAFSISTANTPELAQTAELVKEQWRKIGVEVTVKVFDQGDFNQTILRPRKYEALLFGEIVGRDLDLYPFWHSAERNDPGLNIALYANSKVDKALSEARTTLDRTGRLAELNVVQQEISKDLPALFLYSPEYIYILPKRVKNFKMKEIVRPEERFVNVYEWYINEDKVWKVFAR